MNMTHAISRSRINFILTALVAFAVAALMSPSANAQSGTRTQPPVRSQSSQTGSGSKPAGSSVKQSGSGMKKSQATVGLDSYCPVCIIEMKKWVKGTSRYPVEFDGKTYLFPSEKEKQMFMRTPEKYAPILGGDCIVAKVEMNRRVPGTVQHAALHNGHLYLFANEQAKGMFRNNKEKYVNADLAFDGKCSVCLAEMSKPVEGVPEFTTTYKGMRYLFPSSEQQQMFKLNPSKYEDRQ